MSRKIKFRIWDKEAKKFLENDCSLHACSNWTIDPFTGELANFIEGLAESNGPFYTKHEAADWWMNGMEIVKESPFVVQQFTGKNDINDKEIYEGDIGYMNYHGASPEWEKKHNIFVIVFRDGAFQIKPVRLSKPQGFGAGGGNLFFSHIALIVGHDENGDPIYKYELPPPKPISEINIFEVIGNIFENPELQEQ